MDPGLPRGRFTRWKWGSALAGGVFAAAAAMVGWRLWQDDYFWRNPLADAQITRLTDFEGDEQGAAISPDGKVVAFISHRDGPNDAWVGQVGSRSFVDLTKGRFPNIF